MLIPTLKGHLLQLARQKQTLKVAVAEAQGHCPRHQHLWCRHRRSGQQ